MKQITAYGVRIHAASMKPVQDMVRIYRQPVTFLIKVCNEQWNSISDEKCTHHRGSACNPFLGNRMTGQVVHIHKPQMISSCYERNA